MGNIYRPQLNQTWFDLAIQETGSMESIFDLLDENNLYLFTKNEEGNLEETEVPVQKKLKSNLSIKNTTVYNYFSYNSNRPATAIPFINFSESIEGCSGIGCMIIGQDFTVY